MSTRKVPARRPRNGGRLSAAVERITCNRDAGALVELNVRLDVSDDTLGEQNLAAGLELGAEATRARWVQEGRLLSSKEMSLVWRRTRQALEQACKLGELVSLKIGGKRWYPTVFGGLDA